MHQRLLLAFLIFAHLAAACGPPAEGAAPAAATSGEEGLPPQVGDAPPTLTPTVVANTAAAAEVVPVADPIAVSPDIYKVVLDGPRMRILEGTWKPKQSDKPHGHPPLVAYALTDVRGLAHGESGDPVRVELKAGQAFFQNAVRSHTFENVGKKPARFLIVELKQGVPPEPMPDGYASDAVAASPDVYRRIFEDRQVRVLHAAWEPGKLDELHAHPGLAAYFLTDIDAKLHGSFGQTTDIQRKAGQALFQKPVRGHMLENVGKKLARMVLFEPKAPAFGGASASAAAGEGGSATLPVEEGDGEVSSFVDTDTGVKLDIGGGFTFEVQPGVKFSTVVTFKKTTRRPSNSHVGGGFTRHAATLDFDGTEETLAKPVLVGIGIRRMPTKKGARFVLAMEYESECTKQNRRYELEYGGCSSWKIIPTEFDEERGKVIAKLSSTGGYRLQFGWIPE